MHLSQASHERADHARKIKCRDDCAHSTHRQVGCNQAVEPFYSGLRSLVLNDKVCCRHFLPVLHIKAAIYRECVPGGQVVSPEQNNEAGRVRKDAGLGTISSERDHACAILVDGPPVSRAFLFLLQPCRQTSRQLLRKNTVDTRISCLGNKKQFGVSAHTPVGESHAWRMCLPIKAFCCSSVSTCGHSLSRIW
jgi:hypothetical protein